MTIPAYGTCSPATRCPRPWLRLGVAGSLEALAACEAVGNGRAEALEAQTVVVPVEAVTLIAEVVTELQSLDRDRGLFEAFGRILGTLPGIGPRTGSNPR